MSTTPGDRRRIGDSLTYSITEGTFACAQCDYGLGPVNGNFKERTVKRERPVKSISKEFHIAEDVISVRMVFREFFCPGCGLRLDTEIARIGDDILADLVLVVPVTNSVDRTA